MQILIFIVLLIFSYVLGSISSAILICKLLGLPDPRKEGSGNPGASNVSRIAGKKVAAVVFIGDALKGIVPLVIAHHFHLSLLLQGYIGLAAILGHSFPLFFKFKGGKGVATFFGVLLMLSWPIALLLIMLWVIVAKLFHYASAASILTAVLAPFITFYFYRPLVVLPIFLMSLLIIYRHKKNIFRLLKKKENKLGV